MIIDIIIARKGTEVRYSKQRSLILDIVRSNPVHPTAEWVYEQARKEMPSIGIATVYRNLNALTEMGAIGKITGVGGIDRFDGNISPHFHLQCTECGRLIDLPAKDPQAAFWLKQMIRDLFSVEDENVTVTTTLLQGVCNDCMAAEEFDAN